MDGTEVETVCGEHVFKFKVPIDGVHRIKAVSGDQSDEMEIAKVTEPNPSYFASADEVRNWFDEPKEVFETPKGYFSLNNTMGEISANPAGKMILDKMMAAMNSKTAGGMGEGVEISPSVQDMIARQPLKKLLVQGGISLDSKEAIELNAALNRIKM